RSRVLLQPHQLVHASGAAAAASALLCEGEIEPLRLEKRPRVDDKVKAARIPANGVLGAQGKGGSNLALVDGVVGRGGQQEGVRIANGRVTVYNQVPPAVTSR